MASGAFQGPSPYDDAVTKITSNTEEDWGAILDLCDKVTSEKEKGYVRLPYVNCLVSPAKADLNYDCSAKDALKAIVNKISNPNPKVAVMAVTVCSLS